MIGYVLRDEPIKVWQQLENGKYMCDGDCGRWSMHGVCTCGLNHYFKFEGGRFDKIERDNVSWRREDDTERHMHDVPRTTHCTHGVHLDSELECLKCKEEFQQAMDSFKMWWNGTEDIVIKDCKAK